MDNCIFTGHCTEPFCDQSCPALAETSYLLDRNGISMKSRVFAARPEAIQKHMDYLKKNTGQFTVMSSTDTVADAELLTYCAICTNWRGSRLHCNVYNLKFSKFLEDTKQSWSHQGNLEALEYIRIWCDTAKVLIISNMDYVRFGDFEAQTLLNIIQSRDAVDKTTIVVSPPVGQLVGSRDSVFFTRMTAILRSALADRKAVSR
ncbi:hypothetical protein [uncultured Duncaniella sp.]|uniref:hypothetical protein n=1 Tax=uncultured Duncaniella sp. TaxID=2768039 RepID=UPI00261E27F6|nr:hypothetical protein [uncultured Duncaniella sp.]